METKSWKILLVEDNPQDARLLQEMLGETSFKPFELAHVKRLAEALKRLGMERFDLVLLDLFLPDSQEIETFIRLQEEAPDVPVVVLTSLEIEEIALEAVRRGAQDYLFKGRVTPDGLAQSMRYALQRKRAEAERIRMVMELEERLRQVKVLGGLLLICTRCRKVRDDQGVWHPLEDYIKSHSEVCFGHGLCPLCSRKHSYAPARN